MCAQIDACRRRPSYAAERGVGVDEQQQAWSLARPSEKQHLAQEKQTHQSNQSDVENDHRVTQMGSGPRLNEGLCYTNTPPEEAI
jgi:hypothetical protein